MTRILLRIAAVLGVTLALLAICELGLRLAGFRADLSGEALPIAMPMFRPAPGADGTPLLQRQDAPVSFKRDKPANGFRVFIVGESSAFGFPFGPEYAFSRFLQERLTAAWPERAVEVVNAALPGIGSWQVRRIVDEIVAYQPDVLVVYLGHNELSRTGPAESSRLARWLSQLRFYQLAVVAADHLRGRGGAMPTVERMQRDTDPFGPIRDRARGKVTQSNAERERSLERTRENLLAIVDAARGAGAEVVLAGVAQNFSDHPPGASRHRRGLSEDERTRWRAAMQAAAAHIEAEEWQACLDQLRLATAIDSHPAIAHFMRGQCLAGLGRYDDARAAFHEASDRDAVPLGAPERVNRVVADVAAERGVPYVDVVAALERSAPHGLLGRELFCDSIHPSVAGHAAIAAIIGESLGVASDAVPPPDVAALLAAHPEIEDKIYRTNTVFYLILGWHDKAYAEADEAMRRYPDMQKARDGVNEFRAKDPVRAWDDLPEEVD